MRVGSIVVVVFVYWISVAHGYLNLDYDNPPERLVIWATPKDVLRKKHIDLKRYEKS